MALRLSLWVLTYPCLNCFLRYTVCFNHITVSTFLYLIFIVCSRVLQRVVHGKIVNMGPGSQNYINNNTINFNDTTFLHWVKIFTLSKNQWQMKLQGPYSQHLYIELHHCHSILTAIYNQLKIYSLLSRPFPFFSP